MNEDQLRMRIIEILREATERQLRLVYITAREITKE